MVFGQWRVDCSVEACGKGTVELNVCVSQNRSETINVKDVIYVPKLRNNLLSVSAIMNKGYQINFGRNNAVVQRADGSIILTATKYG